MNFTEFVDSLTNDEPSGELNSLLLALWYERNGNWEKAHTLVQDIKSKEAAWIHAYLHRREGDPGNASYWYRRAGRTTPTLSMDEEWDTIVTEML